MKNYKLFPLSALFFMGLMNAQDVKQDSLHKDKNVDEVIITGTLKPISKSKSPVPVEIYTKKFFEKNPKIFGVFFKRQYCPAKRGKHHQLSNEKGGENVEPNRREFIKQCAFQKFCNTVLHNEACDAHKELHRHKAKEITFSDLTLEEARQLHTFDEYFKGETAFERAGKKITPKLLLEAIRTLPEEKRKAVLLYYFEGMNDTEIAELFDTSRSTIQYRRTSSFELLKKYLEENADEWDEW